MVRLEISAEAKVKKVGGFEILKERGVAFDHGIKLIGLIGNCDLDINIKGDREDLEAVLSDLNLYHANDVIEIKFIPNPQVRLDDLSDSNHHKKGTKEEFGDDEGFDT